MNRQTAEENGLILTAWPRLNKRETLGEYISNPCGYSFQWTRVTEVVCLTCDEWDEFTHALTEPGRDWLDGKGGNYSLQPFPEGVTHYHELPEDQQAAWKRDVFNFAILVVRPGSTSEESTGIYVDPQGYGYARYVGFFVAHEDKDGCRQLKATNPPNLPILSEVMDTMHQGRTFATRVMECDEGQRVMQEHPAIRALFS